MTYCVRVLFADCGYYLHIKVLLALKHSRSNLKYEFSLNGTQINRRHIGLKNN